MIPLAEFAPAAPAAGASIALLETVLLFALAVALSILWFHVIRKIVVPVANLRILRTHPFSFLHGWIDTIDRWIKGTEAGTERGMTWSFHALMWSISTGYKQTRDLAELVYHIATTPPALVTGSKGANEPRSISPRIKTLEREYRGIDHRVDELERHEHAKRGAGAAAGTIDTKTFHRELKGIDTRLDKLEKTYLGIDHTATHVGTKIGTKTGTKTATKPRAVPRTRAHANKWTDVLTHKGLLSVGVAALAAMGLSWLRCPSLLRMGKRFGCRGFSRLEPFLATTFEALAILDLCRFALATQALARLIVPQLGAVLLVQNAVCLGGGASVASAMDKPTISTKIALPSGLLESEV